MPRRRIKSGLKAKGAYRRSEAGVRWVAVITSP